MSLIGAKPKRGGRPTISLCPSNAPTKINLLSSVFEPMEGLIDHNHCDYGIKRQSKIDRNFILSTQPIPDHEKINVIIR